MRAGLGEEALRELGGKIVRDDELAGEQAVGLGVGDADCFAVLFTGDVLARGHDLDDLCAGFLLVRRDGFNIVAVEDVVLHGRGSLLSEAG